MPNKDLSKTPDPNAQAPRPGHVDDEAPPQPDMDHPPPARPGAATAFDKGTAAADREARSGTVPGPNDFDAQQRDDPTYKDAPPPRPPRGAGKP